MKTKKKWLLVPVTAAMLAVGAIGSMSVYADTTPPATAAAEAAETTAPEQAEPNEPALPGGGHADANGANVDYQFDGIE
jgi:hypothetical protein